VERRVEIIIDAQKMNAFLVFHPPDGDTRGPERSEIDEVVQAQNIRFGIMEEKINAFLSTYIPGVPHPFARGILAQPCQDADIVFNFDMEQLKAFCSGKLSQSDKNLYRNFIVKKGTLIAKKDTGRGRKTRYRHLRLRGSTEGAKRQVPTDIQRKEHGAHR